MFEQKYSNETFLGDFHTVWKTQKSLQALSGKWVMISPSFCFCTLKLQQQQGHIGREITEIDHFHFWHERLIYEQMKDTRH